MMFDWARAIQLANDAERADKNDPIGYSLRQHSEETLDYTMEDHALLMATHAILIARHSFN
jgi:hypothetical protein